MYCEFSFVGNGPDMLLLFILGLLGSTLSVPVTQNTEVIQSDENLSQLYVLPAESFPTFYDVQLFIDPSNISSFNGIASIRVIPYFDTSEIVMQAMELQMQEISVTAESSTVNLFDNYTLATDDTHFLRIRTSTPLLSLRPYTVTITYSGAYSENMFGLYVSTYQENGQTVNLVTSQLQPTFARRAFPCYDEPSFKAVFRTTIYAPPAYTTVRSNMPLRNDTLKPDVTGYTKHEFEDTLVMSSYLIAYLVSNFEYVDNTQDPLYRIPFRVYSRPGTQNTADFALEFGQKNMVALEEYTEFPFYFPKMDKAAVPDFAAGAMENWGLVIYREVALLVQDGVTTTSTKQNIGRIICHENMHQWFGNEVGPLSWTYTWLNEGFANFFESFATDLVLPEWRMMDQFILNEQNVFQSDAVLTVNPMTYEVFTPSQILGTFNSVAYQKSGSVIRMMQHFLTPEVFRQGLIIYIKNNSRKAASPTDLYAALQQALDESNHTLPYTINLILDNWVNQGGFPVVNVRRMSPTANSFSISQERFLTDKNLNSNTRWYVPINWVLSTNVDFSDTRPDMWLTTSSIATAYDLPGLSQAEWFIVNKQQTGYYRVNYDIDNWNALATLLTSSHETVHVLNRAQLVDDSFNLARNGRLDYAIPLEISRYLVQEKDYIPWGSANAAFTFLNTVLVGTAVYGHFQNYLLTLTAPLYQELGFSASSEEEWVTPYHRTIITNINCLHGNQDCVNTAEQLLQNFINNPSQTINPDIQTTVFCSGLRGGSETNFNFLWNRYLETSDSSEQSILLNSLGCTTNADSRLFYLNQVIDENSAIRQQDTSSVMTSMINANPENMEVAFDFLIENFPQIQQSVQSLTGTSNILITLANRLTTQEHLNKINEFEVRYQTYFTAGELNAINFIKENIAAAITWNNENFEVVEAWLRENSVGNDNSGATSIGANLSIISCICLALYNLL